MDFVDWGPKLFNALLAVAVFGAVVGLLLLVVDRAPKRGHDRYQLAVFLLPAVVLLAVGLLIPAVRTTILSFTNAAGDFVGLDNYKWLFTEDEALITIRNTIIWTVLTPILATGIGLLYAIVIDKARTEAISKTLVFMPMAISFVGAGIIWKFMYAYRGGGNEQIGLINQFIVWFGGEPKQLLLDPPLNTFLLLIVMVWIQAGFAMVVLSAAIKGIPADIVEAARIDGVNPWSMFWQVTLPSIRGAVIVVLSTITIAVLKVFDIVRTMTGGNFDTSVIANEMYTQAFRFREPGRGAALALLLFVLVIPLVLYQIRVLRQREETR
ncbi:carbohydrate ABC transporter permease [Cryptosporangium arvum]|uniref:Carbohydrate ABC transporter membrane protein 1, CUT1 family n=1 Tax=Cryptosporangium arvum DSM 44712 TaxID=927661 RepID=A0A010ZNS1_9ACTN|nr:sugar ABC transporter permease [Cryptosporangium arvum]EXG80324.1 carbohydrate ABC transporter membrane protein 1, CUT1 family [Cryptosporangium arvum DSM 44712]